jgi:hypothetical protein
MKRIDRPNGTFGWTAAACLLSVLVASPSFAQGMMQLDQLAKEYTLGRFKYVPPLADGWRQIANAKESLTLVYAEQKTPETIETMFGVAMEAHDIPPETHVESAAALADLSRKQMAETRKAELVALSAIEQVPSIENMYTYRLLMRAPVEGKPDAYEVYYVMTSPDKTQYLVIQCITKTPEYGNELYFNQFYGSLSSVKYTPDPAAKKEAAGGAAAAPAPAAPAAPSAPAGGAASAPAGH